MPTVGRHLAGGVAVWETQTAARHREEIVALAARHAAELMATAAVSGPMQHVDSVATARVMVPSTSAAFVLAGRSSRADGGGGVFFHDPNDSTSVDDDGVTTIVTAGGHRLKRQRESVVSGSPRLIYNSARTVRAMGAGSEVQLDGFKAGGSHNKQRGPVCALDQAAGYAYDYTARADGFGAPALTAQDSEMWVAVFARRRPGESVATLCFVPYLKVTAWDSNTRTATFNDSIGAMATGGEWTGCDLLACHENGYFSWRTATIASNTADSVTLAASAASWNLAAGDYLLPAPSQLADYKYLRSLKLDRSPSISPPYEWRNFAFGAGGQVGSATGNPFGNITSLTDIPLDMRGYVSPLAIGWTAAIHVYNTIVSAEGAALYLSHDQGSLHAVARVAIDRIPTAGLGVSCTVSAPFGAKQETYARVIRAENVGTVEILGWTEG